MMKGRWLQTRFHCNDWPLPLSANASSRTLRWRSMSSYDFSSLLEDLADASDQEEAVVISSRSRIIISPRRKRRPEPTEKRKVSYKHQAGAQIENESGKARAKQSAGNQHGDSIADKAAVHEHTLDKTLGRSALPESKDRPTDNLDRVDSDESIKSSSHSSSSSKEKMQDGFVSDELHERVTDTGVSKRQSRKSKQSNREGAGHASAQHDPIGVVNSPFNLDDTAKDSLEELKYTLKQLAKQTDPQPVSGSNLPDYVRAMPAFGDLVAPLPDSVRTAEYSNRTRKGSNSAKQRHFSFQHPKVATQWTDTRPKSKSVAFGDPRFGTPHPDFDQTSLRKKLFTNPSTNATGLSRNTSSVPISSGAIVSSGDGAQGSRALLSALKALQDKIRRLEEERESLSQELSDCKVKARKVELTGWPLEYCSSDSSLCTLFCSKRQSWLRERRRLPTN